jgi:hypothetical protein
MQRKSVRERERGEWRETERERESEESAVGKAKKTAKKCLQQQSKLERFGTICCGRIYGL